MNILAVNRTKEAVKDGGGSSFINKSGIYDVIIKFASIDVSKNGAKSVNFNVLYNNNQQTIYGPYITDRNDNPLDIGLGLVRDKLGVIAGVDGSLEIEEETHNVGKDNKPQTFSVITNFTDLPVKMRIQMEYSINPNTKEIQERKVIKSFFREDGASAEEILSLENGEEVEIGKRLAFETERFANNITYAESSKGAGDAPTPEEVEAWLEARRTGKAAPAKSAPKVNTNTAANKLFKK